MQSNSSVVWYFQMYFSGKLYLKYKQIIIRTLIHPAWSSLVKAFLFICLNICHVNFQICFLKDNVNRNRNALSLSLKKKTEIKICLTVWRLWYGNKYCAKTSIEQYHGPSLNRRKSKINYFHNSVKNVFIPKCSQIMKIFTANFEVLFLCVLSFFFKYIRSPLKAW